MSAKGGHDVSAGLLFNHASSGELLEQKEMVSSAGERQSRETRCERNPVTLRRSSDIALLFLSRVDVLYPED